MTTMGEGSMSADLTIQDLRQLLGWPDLVRVERRRTQAGTTWLMTRSEQPFTDVATSARLTGEYTFAWPNAQVRKPARLSRWLRRPVSDEEARRVVRALHDYCDALEA